MSRRTGRARTKCSRCGKDPAEFYGLNKSFCKDCHKAAYAPNPVRQRATFVLRAYGITIEQYEDLYRRQNGRCAICDKFLPVLGIDHVHGETGIEAVRGLLCKECNRGLGLFGDTLEGVQRALDYLNTYQARKGITTRGV